MRCDCCCAPPYTVAEPTTRAMTAAVSRCTYAPATASGYDLKEPITCSSMTRKGPRPEVLQVAGPQSEVATVPGIHFQRERCHVFFFYELQRRVAAMCITAILCMVVKPSRRRPVRSVPPGSSGQVHGFEACICTLLRPGNNHK